MGVWRRTGAVQVSERCLKNSKKRHGFLRIAHIGEWAVGLSAEKGERLNKTPHQVCFWWGHNIITWLDPPKELILHDTKKVSAFSEQIQKGFPIKASTHQLTQHKFNSRCFKLCLSVMMTKQEQGLKNAKTNPLASNAHSFSFSGHSDALWFWMQITL